MTTSPRSRMGLVELIILTVVAIACAAGIGQLQPSLESSLRGVKELDDVSRIPPPKQLREMTFGYHSAAADLLWASLLVEHGMRFSEKRPFPSAVQYLEGILALEPDHQLLYQFVDTLLVYKPGTVGTAEDARLARQYLERGTRERPFDDDIWLRYGQFIAFLGPSFLTEEKEIEAWRKDGAFAIARAVELGAHPDRTLAATSLLSKAGEKRAAIAQLQRHYALTDDPDTRHQIYLKLQALEASVAVESAVSAVEHDWRSNAPFLSRHAALLIGPHRNPARCAGRESYEDSKCPPDWSAVTAVAH